MGWSLGSCPEPIAAQGIIPTRSYTDIDLRVPPVLLRSGNGSSRFVQPLASVVGVGRWPFGAFDGSPKSVPDRMRVGGWIEEKRAQEGRPHVPPAAPSLVAYRSHRSPGDLTTGSGVRGNSIDIDRGSEPESHRFTESSPRSPSTRVVASVSGSDCRQPRRPRPRRRGTPSRGSLTTTREGLGAVATTVV
jgi:hypothetical protein